MQEENGRIRSIAGVVSGILADNEYLDCFLVDWLTSTSSDASAMGLNARRAVIAVLGEKEGWPRSIYAPCT